VVRLGRGLRAALLGIMAYVARSTGTEPSQEEIAAVLRSYFTLDEVTNQLSYLRKLPREPEDTPSEGALDRLSFRINLAAPTPRNILARAGFFIRPLAESLVLLRRHAASELGSPPSEEEIARSLNSTFITSELKNQIVHARKLSAAPDASSDAADLFPG
jgi:hypothetical protein